MCAALQDLGAYVTCVSMRSCAQVNPKADYQIPLVLWKVSGMAEARVHMPRSAMKHRRAVYIELLVQAYV